MRYDTAVKSRTLPVAAVICLVILAVLACGYFGRAGVSIRPRAQTAAAGGTEPFLEVQSADGRLAFISEKNLPTTIASRASPKPGAHPYVRFLPFRPPDLRRCIWEFDAHHLKLPAGNSALIVACPIWCVALPFLIAPLLWLLRWRKSRPELAGFSVVEVSQRGA